MNSMLRFIGEFIILWSAHGAVVNRRSLLDTLYNEYGIHISERTLENDIIDLKSLRYPITSIPGCHGGYRVALKQNESLFTADEMQLIAEFYLEELSKGPSDNDSKGKLRILLNILRKMQIFAVPSPETVDDLEKDI